VNWSYLRYPVDEHRTTDRAIAPPESASCHSPCRGFTEPRENRLALPNTRFLLHQPLGGVGGPASDIEIEARQILAMRERLNTIFAHATGQTLEKIQHDTERNHWMTAEAARDYGLVGSIVESVPIN